MQPRNLPSVTAEAQRGPKLFPPLGWGCYLCV